MPSALAIFSCRPNSHPFQERHVYMDEPVRIGRSVARCRPAQNNATFDCKVLSRNHALVWFDHKTGKFYLQDTKSSNGTFINSQRLSRGSEESPPCEVLSGDFIQFGVDVTENTRKVTHGCIVSTIKLFLPDGMEARRRSDVTQAPLPLPVDKVAANTPIMYSQELFQLSQYLQEALHREQMLEQKLATLQCLLATTQEASESSWQALIDEDRLLTRLEVMGNQLQSYSKNQTEDGMRNELVTLQEDKFNYEITAKESLRRVLQEKIEVARKLSEVERSLSNTEDECSHLKEMKERNHEELRELANKYNGAVNEIKNLTDKIKLAEGRQEELTQRGQMEKKELQLCIDELEEREQTLQARFEALQADNDFSNERLTALQVGLEQLQEKSIKDNNSLAVKQLKEAVGSSLHKLANFDEVIDAHLQNSQTAAGEHLDNPDRLKENHLVAKDSEMSDTLSPSKDRSSDDTSDGNMDDHELNEPQNRVALLKDELRMANLEPRDREQVIHHLHKELLETQELANTGKQKCLELQALLEEERRSNKQQTEESAKQIQYLQSQLGKLAVDMEELKEQRESSVSSTQEELYSAQEEVLVLHHAMEAATAERERDIAALQRDLGGVTAELEKWRQAASKYEQEINSLQATFQQQSLHQQSTNDLQGEVERLQKGWSGLQQECDCLRSEKTTLVNRLHRLETDLDSSRKQTASLSSSLERLEKSRGEMQIRLGSLQDQHLQDANKLQSQLDQAASRTQSLQREYEDTQNMLCDLRQRYERTEQEKRSINEELEQCKVNLKLLQDKGKNPPILQPAQALFLGLILPLLYWCFSQLW
ncbi:sarcolemmal membrane-associated protein-like isoform X2 [Salvelinus fontinalis]|uniref:sarcolemmal membrane-associated protein-like isoform X2 n=1 Tax=Salvelinus fontinalis TaxID=8038 RepID=UPI0024854738|nr:sarcolemmal membrane-associated protein-like isoform X2 [Salvelinus fontinalis]